MSFSHEKQNEKCLHGSFHNIEDGVIEIKNDYPNKINRSEYFEEYDRQMSKFSHTFNAFQDILINEGGFTKRDKWEKRLRSAIINTDMESMNIELLYGNLSVKVCVLNTLLQDKFKKKKVAIGSYGLIIEVEIEKEKFIVKEISIDEKEENRNISSLESVFKEYFMTKIASVLKIGPKIGTPFGYDILIINKKVIFCLEKCEQINNKMLNFSNEILKLYESLFVLHSNNFIHCDIKPENICWSPSFNKFVFIDYGLSRFIVENIGEKASVQYFGTYLYCCEEMKKLLFKQKGLVDIYYNDLYGLNKTISELNKETTKFEPNERIISKIAKIKGSDGLYEIKEVISVFQFKYYLFCNQFELCFTIIEEETKMLKTLLEILKKNLKTEKLSDLSEKFGFFANKVMNDLLSLNFETTSADKFLSEYHNELYSNDLISNLLPSDFILNLHSKEFKFLLESDIWVQKIFIILCPQYYGGLMNRFNFNASKVIEKVYASLLEKEKESCLKAIKTKFVLEFFKEKLMEMKNIEFLQNLVMLFKGSFDYPNYHSTVEAVLKHFLEKDKALFSFFSIYYFIECQPTEYYRSPFANFHYLAEIIKQKDGLSEELREEKIYWLCYEISTAFLSINFNFARNECYWLYPKIMEEVERIGELLAINYKHYIPILKKKLQIMELGYNNYFTIHKRKEVRDYRETRYEYVLELESFYSPLVKLFQNNQHEMMHKLSHTENLEQINEIINFKFHQTEGEPMYIDCCFWKWLFNKTHLNLEITHILLDKFISYIFKEETRSRGNIYAELYTSTLMIHEIVLFFLFTDGNESAILKVRLLVKHRREKASKLKNSFEQTLIHEILEIIENLLDLKEGRLDISDILEYFSELAELPSRDVLDINHLTLLLSLKALKNNEEKQAWSENREKMDELLMKFYEKEKECWFFLNGGLIEEIGKMFIQKEQFENVLICIEKVREFNYDTESNCFYLDKKKTLKQLIEMLAGMNETNKFLIILNNFSHCPKMKFEYIKYHMELSTFLYMVIQKCYPQGETPHFQRLLKMIAFGMNLIDHENQLTIQSGYFYFFKKFFHVKSHRKLYCIERIIARYGNGKKKRSMILNAFSNTEPSEIEAHMKKCICKE